jgi:hypothetical protein
MPIGIVKQTVLALSRRVFRVLDQFAPCECERGGAQRRRACMFGATELLYSLVTSLYTISEKMWQALQTGTIRVVALGCPWSLKIW